LLIDRQKYPDEISGLASSVTPAPPQEIIEMVENIRNPQGAGAATHE